MTLHRVIVPPSPLQAMLKVERPTVQQNLNSITTNIALEGEGEAQSFFHMGSLIIFMRDRRKEPNTFVKMQSTSIQISLVYRSYIK